jgi:hypothetical protein
MNVKVLETESELLGKKVLCLDGWETAEEIVESESHWRKLHDPAYVFCLVDSTDLITIQLLEDHGYRFSEFRIKSRLFTDETDISTRSFYPYQAELITEPEDLQKALDILLTTRHDDRFSNDPNLGADFSSQRVQANLEKSFHSWPSEFLLGLFNIQRSELVAFRSGVFLSKTEAHYYQYGVQHGSDFEQTSAILDTFTIEFLVQRGVKIINVVSTGYNTPELNRLLKNFDFWIVSTQLLLRKVF